MPPKGPGKKTSAKSKLVLGKALKARLAKRMKELKKLDDKRQALQLDIVRIEVEMATRQIPGSACPVV